jgi:hypothetical protein
MRIIYEIKYTNFLERVFILSIRSYILFTIFFGTLMCIGHFYLFWQFWAGYFLGIFIYTIRYYRRAKFQLIKLSLDENYVYIYFSNKGSKKKIFISIEDFGIKFSEVWINIYVLYFFGKNKLALKINDSQLIKTKELERIFLLFKNEFPNTIIK